MPDRTSWSGLLLRAKAFRLAHIGFAATQLAALAYVWYCGLTRRRSRVLAASVGALLAEGAGLVVGRGNCPFGPLQRALGDSVPLFELVLPPRAAKAAIPVLTGVALGGVVLVALRGPARS